MKDLKGRPIRRTRGDTAADRIELPGLDATGFTFTLTVNTVRNPSGAVGEQLVQISGTIVQTAPAIVDFPWSDDQADQTPGSYWYDIEQVDAAMKKLTIAKNAYTIDQDITK